MVELVVREMKDAPNLGKGKKGSKRGRSGGVDNKRFKKNAILVAGDLYELVTSVTAVLPKETERELQLQTQNLAMERQQVEAEKLFNADLHGKVTKGSKGQTINDFMSQATLKCKRGAR